MLHYKSYISNKYLLVDDSGCLIYYFTFVKIKSLKTEKSLRYELVWKWPFVETTSNLNVINMYY